MRAYSLCSSGEAWLSSSCAAGAQGRAGEGCAYKIRREDKRSEQDRMESSLNLSALRLLKALDTTPFTHNTASQSSHYM